MVRRLWPETPCLIVIRDPVEVMVSCLEKPPGWMRSKRNPVDAGRMFGWSEEAIAAMPNEEFCARALGRFLDVAVAHVGPPCRVMDYASITAPGILSVADFFGISREAIDTQRLESSLKLYSKGYPPRAYEDDRAAKQQMATETVRSAARQWAETPYAILTKTAIAYFWRCQPSLEEFPTDSV